MNPTTGCPGRYCGIIAYDDGSFSECGACPRGYQPGADKICERCVGSPMFYDWLYLGFMALVSLVLHWFFVDVTNKIKRKLYILQLSALVESVAAAVATLLLADPIGQLNVRSCRVMQLSDWYTMLYNPSPDYKNTLHCTQEIVYPLYTIVMTYYAFSLLFMMLLRPFVSHKFMEKKGTRSVYAALYFLPILVVLQAVFGGLIYFLFPYILIIVSVVTCAVHLTSIEEQTLSGLMVSSCTNPRNLAILVGHWILHGYGIIGLTRLYNPTFHGPLLALVPFPTLFYMLTVKFTEPGNLI